MRRDSKNAPIVQHVLDVSFGEDARRARTGAGAGTLCALRRLALGLLQSIKGERSIPAVQHSFCADHRLFEMFMGGG